MIPNTQLRTVKTQGEQAVASFGISASDNAHIMTILRDTLYSDKVLAVLREYSANAWDEHRQAGKGGVPIKVTLPTSMEPTLSIRDFGRGLSHQQVFEVFTQYGASTKRSDNAAVGMLGIGSKSGFAYSDTFTVTSFNGGMKRIYAAVLDPSDKGEMKLLHEGPCGDETGLEIQIPVKQKDIYEFQNKAQNLYRWFSPQPECNVALPKAAEGLKLKNGLIHNDNQGDWVAVMGCIAYRINTDQLHDSSEFDAEMFDRISGALYFGIGEVRINASREELKYDDGTKVALVAKFNSLVDEYVSSTLAEINKGQYSSWEKRLKGQVLSRLNLPMPKLAKELFVPTLSIKEPPKTFCLQRNKNVTNSIVIAADTCFLLQDDKRLLRGFDLNQNDYIVKPLGKSTLVEVRAEMDAIFEELGMTGVPIKNLSERNWVQPYRKGGNAPKSQKHKVSAFKLKSDNLRFYRPWSNNWEVEAEREPTEDDVYVIIQNFQSVGFDFYHQYAADARVAKVFGLDMPEVYGYKTTTKKPVVSATGIEYREWRKQFIKDLGTDRAEELAANWAWAKAASRNYYRGYSYYDDTDVKDKAVAKLAEGLGDEHLITQFAVRAVAAQDFIKKEKINDVVFAYLEQNVLPKSQKDEVKEELNDILSSYPLLVVNGNSLSELWGTHSKQWIEYIKLVDASK